MKYWWKYGVIYQIYTRSFYDSNNDGIGDINGIIEKIDYLNFIEIDAIWISPIHPSSDYDYGYDVNDYYSIDSRYGTINDFENLIEILHKNNIKLIMDMVFNHTSIDHQWFIESKKSLINPKRDWYIWKKPKKNKPPSNWKSAFGGSSWEYDIKTGEYYLHSFLKEQPDLNWWNPEVRKEIINIMDFWIEKGVDGFRMDALNWFIKDRFYRNNIPLLSRFFHHYRYDMNRPELIEIIIKLRKKMKKYKNKILIGEVFTLPPGDPYLSSTYLGNGKNMLHLSFDFSLLYRWWNAKQFYKVTKKWINSIPKKGWPCHLLSNHDQPRSRSRLGNNKNEKEKVITSLFFLLTIKGTPFLYYGEEIGMKNNGALNKKNIIDPLGKKYWPFYKGRDLSRNPMQWDNTLYYGFSRKRPWTPIRLEQHDINIESQKNTPDSILNTYKKLISIRNKNIELKKGEMRWISKGNKNILSYERIYKNKSIIIILNFSSSLNKFIYLKNNQVINYLLLFSTHRNEKNFFFKDLCFKLYPYEAMILKKTPI